MKAIYEPTILSLVLAVAPTGNSAIAGCLIRE